jgi:hypothetical protein
MNVCICMDFAFVSEPPRKCHIYFFAVVTFVNSSLCKPRHVLGQSLFSLLICIIILILILKDAIDATGPRVLFYFSLVLYCLTVISPCTGVLSCLGPGSGYGAC